MNIAIGAGIGAIIGAGIEGWKQVITGDYDLGRLDAATAGGAVAGGLAGATMGLSLVAEGGTAAAVGVTAVSSAAGGSTTRALMGEEVTAGTVAADATVGVITHGVLKGAGAAVNARMPGIPRILSSRGGTVSSPKVAQIRADMESGDYRFQAPEGRIGGWVNSKGEYMVNEGNHRMTAAMETGNPELVNKLIENGRWTQVENFPTKAYPLPPKD